jgi:hypothetical protein
VEVGAYRRHAVGALQPDAPIRCSTLQQSIFVPHVHGRVQVVFDLRTLFRVSGVVTQARITRRGPRARVRTLQPPPPARRLPFATPAWAAGDGRCSALTDQQGDATLGKWTESFAVQSASGAH